MNVSETDIIEAFEEIREYVFGVRRRDLHETDIEMAREWLANGLTLPLAGAVFYSRMSFMHEKSLSHGKEKENIPWALSIFDENIQTALRRVHAGGDIASWEQTESQWYARLLGYKRSPSLWNEDMWGPPPTNENCRAPHRILMEIFPEYTLKAS